MSRMSKFLKQTCVFERVKYSKGGLACLNKFGDIVYESPIIIKCRRERVVKNVQTNTGAVLQSSTRYFTDEMHSIGVNDRLDGKVVLQVSEYVNQLGKSEGYECYV